MQKDEVVRTALKLLNEVGIDGLSTRRLAAELGVQSPALYWHFKNKRELLDLMAEAMQAEALPPDRRPSDDWTVWLAADARAKRKALLAYRDGARVHHGTVPTAAELPAIESQVRALCDEGFTPLDALRLLLAVERYLMGWVTEEQAWLQNAHEPLYPDLDDVPLLKEAAVVLRMEDRDADFEHGLMLLIEGAKTRCERTSGTRD
ncbi:TetR/AcrR family transcriptional regulator C-terminal domain-containing protein [Lentzea sp. NPDC006480]|uniref:TetR/AcrR family transcriptional regulator C-terminal domain-containing protein n=1 Tax=Lentzea sp. NPDC006480 TaxID=3157176 RepID=UPI0033ADB46F